MFKDGRYFDLYCSDQFVVIPAIIIPHCELHSLLLTLILKLRLFRKNWIEIIKYSFSLTLNYPTITFLFLNDAYWITFREEI